MAETATLSRSDDKKKKKEVAEPITPKTKVKTKTKVKKDKDSKPKKEPGKKAGRKAEGKSKAREGFDGLAKLVDHPLVADLLAAGAIAAVAAIAEHQMGKRKGETSSKMVRSAGKAAAAAMGAKLMGSLGEIGGAAADAVKKG